MKLSRFFSIIGVAVIIAALVIMGIVYFTSLNTPEEITEDKPVTEISVWGKVMGIECPEETTAKDCRAFYEASVSEVTGLQPDGGFATALVEDLQALADFEGTDEKALKTIAGWDPQDKFELSPLYGEEFLKAIKDEDLEYIFIGIPEDAYEATSSDSPYIPVTLVKSDQSVIGTFDFSYINFGGAVVPCIKDLCNVG